MFDIAGAGTFQLVDWKETIRRFFTFDEEIVVDVSPEDLKSKIMYYMDKPELREKISLAARRRARNEHTFYHRAALVLKDLRICQDST